MPITFDSLLEEAGIDPTRTHFARHQDNFKGRRHKSIYEMYRINRDEFDLYQSIQGKKRFTVGNTLASFVVVPQSQGASLTVFVGLYDVTSCDTAPDGMTDSYRGHDVSGKNLYSLASNNCLSSYRGKLAIDWGKGFVSWVQIGGKNPKEIVELRRQEYEPEFPGFLRFTQLLSEIKHLPESWAQRLSEAKGVYILTSPSTGEAYVGSATGAGGFFARWQSHAKVGGDAVIFKSREPSDYQVAILEVAGSNASEQDILDAEYLWMEKLQTNKMGLNGGMLRNGKEKPVTVEASPPSSEPR